MKDTTFSTITTCGFIPTFPEVHYILIIAIIGYLLGSIPFGLVLCKLLGYGDIRKIGSGNIGATNVLRASNKIIALATLLLDAGKGAFAILIVKFIFFTHILFYTSNGCISFNKSENIPCKNDILNHTEEYRTLLIAGLFAVIGHCYPIWLKFKGGKGVATTLGTLLTLSPITGFITCGVWLLSAAVTRISSLSALVALAASPLIAIYFDKMERNFDLPLFCILIAALVYFKHRENIKRIFTGQEPKIGQNKNKQ